MTENTSKTVQIHKPKVTQEVEQIDLRPLYPSVEYFDENGKPISCLRGVYELGDGGGEIAYSSIEREGYRNFIKKVRWKSLEELNNYDLTPEEWELCDLNRPAIPRSEERAKGGHTTIWGETVPHTKVNAPLTQNPEYNGILDGGCGENKSKYCFPCDHPISFKSSCEYWDEGQYIKIFDLRDKSPDIYNLMDPVYFACKKTKQQESSYIIYLNQNNNQVYVLCPKCYHNTDKKCKEWHQITDPATIDYLSEEDSY